MNTWYRTKFLLELPGGYDRLGIFSKCNMLSYDGSGPASINMLDIIYMWGVLKMMSVVKLDGFEILKLLLYGSL